MSVTLAAPVERVWAAVSDLSSHVEWMADAESIAFRTDQRSGVGTIMEVVTDELCTTVVASSPTTSPMNGFSVAAKKV